MKINVGSKNKAKVEAVAEIIKEYPHLARAEVEGVVDGGQSGVDSQPKSIEVTIHGAMNRAKSAFHDCDYAIGIESGLMKIPETKTGYMDVCACAIYDGKEFHLGLSSAWELKSIFDLVLNDGLDISEAGNQLGMTDNPGIGAEEGVIGIITKGRLNRKEYTKQALRTALIHLDP